MHRILCAVLLLLTALPTLAQDYFREKKKADDILSGLFVGEAVWIRQAEGHEFLGLLTPADNPHGAVVLGHGRGWSPDYELYGVLRVKLAERGWTTLSIQLPILGGGAKVGDYIPTYPDAAERYDLAARWLKARGFKKVAIVSHSLGATMANQYLINAKQVNVDAWVFVSIINGLEEMFRIKIPVLDIYGSKDWEVTQVGSAERLRQISKVPGSKQVMVKGALHFFEQREDELADEITTFLDATFGTVAKPVSKP
ncbi:MAG: alpha/beta hydrolase family protein [Burkholderiales bacterium]|nr:alpha/beta hydrolase family protein [Burkholderiales bacterium]